MDDQQRKKRLKEKIREKRGERTGGGGGGASPSSNCRKDPATALLSMGIDDPNILRAAPAIASKPREALRRLREAASLPEGGSSDEEAMPGS